MFLDYQIGGVELALIWALNLRILYRFMGVFIIGRKLFDSLDEPVSLGLFPGQTLGVWQIGGPLMAMEYHTHTAVLKDC